MKHSVLLIIILFLCSVVGHGAEQIPEINKRRQTKYNYQYNDRKHKWKEGSAHLAGVYAVSWLVYPLSQPKIFKNKGSFKHYKKNFGQLAFDQDEPFWNWFVHPLSGSQLFLYYRANGYSRSSALGMAFLSSTLFEFTIEIYTEPASFQDLYQTPILGAVLGVGIEKISLYLLNTGNPMGKFFGHLINPSTLFWFYEGKVLVNPIVSRKGIHGLRLMANF